MKTWIKTLCVTATLSLSISQCVFAAMNPFTVVIGNKAFDIDYVNNQAHEKEIRNLFLNSNNEIYIKLQDGTWVENSSGEKVNKDIIPEVIYTSETGRGMKYLKGDGDNIGDEINLLPQFQMPEIGEEIAVMHTNKGIIKFRLFEQYAPKAVANFKKHVIDGYYNNTTFHRVINDFMIQGGDPTGTGVGGESVWGKPFEDEFDVSLHNFRGALCMANAGPNTNGSQFFIVQKMDVSDNFIKEMNEIGDPSYSPMVAEKYKEVGGTPWLDYKHTVFGQVIEGMDIVDSIAEAKTGYGDKPLEDIIIEKIHIVQYDK